MSKIIHFILLKIKHSHSIDNSPPELVINVASKDTTLKHIINKLKQMKIVELTFIILYQHELILDSNLTIAWVEEWS